ncbi:hypothetical protein ABZP36_001205 [Zizania latifolia]
MSTAPATASETSTQILVKDANQEKEAASSSSSSSSEEIDEDDFFQIEGPMLSSQFSLSAAPAEDDSGKAKQTPPVQAMSRASDECPDPKRIPSSVFARSKSTTPTDWSVTSNESLFSINVGNASFSKDHLFLYGKTGELGPNDPLAPLPPLPRQSPSSSPIKGEVLTKDKPSTPKDKGDGRGLADQNGEENPDSIHSLSRRSDGSTTSFAFPILTGEAKTSGSLKDSNPELARQSTAQLTHPTETQNENKETPVAMDFEILPNVWLQPNPEQQSTGRGRGDVHEPPERAASPSSTAESSPPSPGRRQDQGMRPHPLRLHPSSWLPLLAFSAKRTSCRSFPDDFTSRSAAAAAAAAARSATLSIGLREASIYGGLSSEKL